MPYKDIEARRRVSREYARRYRKDNPEKTKVNRAEWCLKNRVKILARRKELRKLKGKEYLARENEMVKRRRDIARRKVVEHYGNKCNCCGLDIYEFLTIDHVNGGGCKHRKVVTATRLPFWIIENNYPIDYQILCYNCNCAKAFTKTKLCPHQTHK